MLVATIRLGGILALLYALTRMRCAGPPFEQLEHLLSSASDSRPLSHFASAVTDASHVPNVAAPSTHADESWADLYGHQVPPDHEVSPFDSSTEAAYSGLDHDLYSLMHQQGSSQVGSSSSRLKESVPASPLQLLSDVQQQFWDAITTRKVSERKKIGIVLPFTGQASPSALQSYTDALTMLHLKYGVWPYNVGGNRFLLHEYTPIKYHLHNIHGPTTSKSSTLLFGVWEQTGNSAHDPDTNRYIGAFETPTRGLTRRYIKKALVQNVQRIASGHVLSSSTAKFTLLPLRKPIHELHTMLDHHSGTSVGFPSTVEQSSQAFVTDHLSVPPGTPRLLPVSDATPILAPPYRSFPFALPLPLTKEQKESLLNDAIGLLLAEHSNRVMKAVPFVGLDLTGGLLEDTFGNVRKSFWVLSDTLVLVRQTSGFEAPYAAPYAGMISSQPLANRLYLWQRSPVPDYDGYLYQLVGMIDADASSTHVTGHLPEYKAARKIYLFLARSDLIFDQTKLNWKDK
ncbi:uncharacterized protein UTRI_02781 [Ustilago trichophora]|uniref:Uncharacterized protein n=1 Tax=Ustilago trichophora TaxID=86804 RepID=A0A5C3ENK5_9BASI|nr:uncharacterized protein UTRI_02781 [Ustilago trichophora]